MADTKQKIKPENGTKSAGQPAQGAAAQAVINTGEKRGAEVKKSGFIFVLLAFLVALLIIIGVLGAAFYYVVHNNFNNIAVKYRNQIAGIPVARLALPKQPDSEDPDNIPPAELKQKFAEMKNMRDEYKQKLDAAVEEIAALKKSNNEINTSISGYTRDKTDLDALKADIDKRELELKETKKKVDELVANGDKSGFKQYFEKLDKETAQRLYSEILKEEKLSEDVKKFAQLYENMEPASAAAIFEQLGDANITLVCETLKNMKKEVSAQVIAAFNPVFGAKVTQKLSDMYKGTAAVPAAAGTTASANKK